MRIALIALLVAISSPLCTAQSRKTPDVLVKQAQNRFVLITTQCQLGSGFLTGHTHLGLHEVVTAYHLTRCPRRAGKAVVRADGTRAIITSVSRKNDLMRVLVKLHRRVLPVVVRTKLVTGEQVFAVGSNSRGRRHLVVNGHVLIFSPGYIMSKLMVPHGGSGGQLVGVKDGAVIGVPLSQGLGFTSSADGQTLLDFIALARRRDALSLSKLNRAFQN